MQLLGCISSLERSPAVNDSSAFRKHFHHQEELVLDMKDFGNADQGYRRALVISTKCKELGSTHAADSGYSRAWTTITVVLDTLHGCGTCLQLCLVDSTLSLRLDVTVRFLTSKSAHLDQRHRSQIAIHVARLGYESTGLPSRGFHVWLCTRQDH